MGNLASHFYTGPYFFSYFDRVFDPEYSGDNYLRTKINFRRATVTQRMKFLKKWQFYPRKFIVNSKNLSWPS